MTMSFDYWRLNRHLSGGSLRAVTLTLWLEERSASAGQVVRSSPTGYSDEYLAYGQPPFDSNGFSRELGGYIHARIGAPLCVDHTLPLPAARPAECATTGGQGGGLGVGLFHAY
jgi:hypothetical protein